MNSKPSDLPADLASAYLALLSEREMLQAERDVVVAERDTVVAERDIAVAQAANAQAMLSDSEALIARLELAIEKLKRELHGQRSERTARLIDQMELQLEELVMAATEDEVAAQAAAARTSVRSFARKRPVRKPWPEDIERQRVVIDPPATCACCGGSRLSKLGEDVTETLEEIPRRFKVIETVREKFTCRDCEAISQPPAPFPARPNGRRMPRHAASSALICWRRSCLTSSACTVRSTARAHGSNARASSFRPRRWPTRSGLVHPPSCRSLI
jgi:hypothetical protein